MYAFRRWVARVTPGRLPYSALSVILFQRGLIPFIKCLSLSDNLSSRSVKLSIALAVMRLPTSPGANPNVNTVSALSFTHVPNRSSIAQQFLHRTQTQAKRQPNTLRDTRVFKKSPGGSNPRVSRGGPGRTGPANTQGGGSASGGGSSSGGRSGRGGSANNEGKARPRCTSPGCKKPIDHTVEMCFQRKRATPNTDSNHTDG